MYYLRARIYDPATAQFLTRDPLVPLTKQPYLYASDDPLNRTDSSGLLVFGLCGGVAGGYYAGGQGQVCNVTDFHGFANTGTLGGGFQTPQAGIGVSLLIDWGSTRVDEEAGWSYYAGASGFFKVVGVSVGGALDTSCGWLRVRGKEPSSVNLGVGLGAAPADASAGVARTWVHKLSWQQELQLLFPVPHYLW